MIDIEIKSDPSILSIGIPKLKSEDTIPFKKLYQTNS